MTEKRFTIKSQDDYFGITDNNVGDKMNVINGIHTEIEAKWLCDLLNALHEEKDYWKKRCLLVENKYGELPSKVKLKDIIGLVKTDEPTNSVELKKELYK